MRRTRFAVFTALLALLITTSTTLAATRILKTVYTASSGTLATTALAQTNFLRSMVGLAAKGDSTTLVGKQLIVNGSEAGLGKTDAQNKMEAIATPIVVCSNQGGNTAPGQNPPNVTVQGVQLVPSQDITQNGTATIFVKSDPLPPEVITQVGTALGCPNDNWVGTITNLHFTQATLSVWQNGKMVASQTTIFP